MASFVQYYICVCSFSWLYSIILCEYRLNCSTIYGHLFQVFIMNNASLTSPQPHTITHISAGNVPKCQIDGSQE